MDAKYVIERLKDAENILKEISHDSNIFFEIGRAMGVIQCTAIHIEAHKEGAWDYSKE